MEMINLDVLKVYEIVKSIVDFRINIHKVFRVLLQLCNASGYLSCFS